MAYVDIFPARFSKKVSKIKHPDDDELEDWIYNPELEAFIIFSKSRDNHIRYLSRTLDKEKCFSLGRESKFFNRRTFEDKEIDFLRILTRYLKNPHDSKTDKTGLCFKLKNVYIVKSFFTFGLRRVPSDCAHVIQTTRVPMLIYICPDKLKCRHDESVFPHKDLRFYTRKLLSSRRKYKIPPDTEYVLLTIQKTLFRLDVVPLDFQLPFICKNAIKKIHDQQEKDPLRDFFLEEMFKPFEELGLTVDDFNQQHVHCDFFLEDKPQENIVDPTMNDSEHFLDFDWIEELFPNDLNDLDELFQYIN